MVEYDIYLPLHHNDGRLVEPARIAGFKKQLTDHFGGLTHFPQENEGVWKFGGITFRDRVVILRVMAAEQASSRAFLAGFKRRLQDELEQEDVLVVERQVSAVQ